MPSGTIPCTQTSKNTQFGLDFSHVIAELFTSMKLIHLLCFRAQLDLLFFLFLDSHELSVFGVSHACVPYICHIVRNFGI